MSNVSIAIVVNTYQKYHRQNVAVESLRHIKKSFPDNVKLYNIQFKDEINSFIDHYEGLETCHVLKESSLDYIVDARKKLPLISEIISEAFLFSDCDYVLYANSDVILLPRLIEIIINDAPDCMTGPRLEINDINSFQEVLNDQVVPIRVEIAGFDFFVFEKGWFKKYEEHFISKFVIGKPFFDVVIAGLMVIFGKKCIIANSYPLCALHIFHENTSVLMESPEKTHNENIFKNNILFKIADNIIYYNLQNNLCKRKPWGVFLQPQKDEQQIQKTFFDSMNIHHENQIKYIE
jgi:hypothetical protein